MMHFLIVGHTHCVIDQYFSVISRKIFNAEFIATPHALHALILHPNVDDGSNQGGGTAMSIDDGKSKKGVVPVFCKFIEVRGVVFTSSLMLTAVAGGVRLQDSV